MFHICSCINIFTVQLISYLCIFNMSPIPTCQMRQLSQKPIHLTSVQHQTTALNLQAYRSCNLQAKSKCFEIFNFTETLQGFFWVLHLKQFRYVFVQSESAQWYSRQLPGKAKPNQTAIDDYWWCRDSRAAVSCVHNVLFVKVVFSLVLSF